MRLVRTFRWSCIRLLKLSRCSFAGAMRNTAMKTGKGRLPFAPPDWPEDKLPWGSFWGRKRDRWSDAQLEIVEEWLDSKAPLHVWTTGTGDVNITRFGESKGGAAAGVAAAGAAGGPPPLKRARVSAGAGDHDDDGDDDGDDDNDDDDDM